MKTVRVTSPLRLILVFCAMGLISCASLKVEAPKDPIKVDIAMRLDVYQHVQKDIDAIENMVTGGAKEKSAPAAKDSGGKDKVSLLDLLSPISSAYAQEGLSPELESAAMRRRDRFSALSSLESQGIVGENKSGLVEIRGAADASAQSLVSAENSDRMSIYQGIASKNGTSVGEVQQLYAARLQGGAPSGTPVETPNGEWKTK